MPQQRRSRKPADQPALPPIDASGLPSGASRADISDPSTVVLVRNAQLASALRERDAIAARLDQSGDELTDLRVTVRQQEGELGRLRAVADTVEPLRKERDQLLQRVSDIDASTDVRIRDAVKAALDESGAQHKTTVAKLTEERDGLAAQVETLRGQLEDKGVTGRVEPTELAGQFASVLDQLGTPTPQAGRPYSAALTSLEVEARGVLEAAAEGKTQPMLRTVESGVDPGQLSSLRMSFRLLPHAGEMELPGE